ncbi:putative glutaredoxin-C6 [Iris pallida]|uniref:Glutaredoxin-C6 n=1 Tax=Iris pallida TaxID=29817 RepID=A0AAX6E5V2_IRIPA|nr:putative glutaredoxin-C6 [Iris pallida]KAJ6811256.1 putative glutaredoxin-C6 [Iris pallida]
MPKCIKYMFLNVNNLLIIICFPIPKNLRSETHRTSPIPILCTLVFGFAEIAVHNYFYFCSYSCA